MSDRRSGFLWSRKLLSMLPKPVRFHIMREKIKIRSDLDPRLTFRIAKTREELSEAYRILHDCYIEMGYTKEEPSGMRIVKYFALPTTTTLIACFDDRVVGTLSIIRRTAMGLPMESAFNLDQALGSNQVIAEVSSLAIDSRFRQKRGALFLPFIKYLWEYISQYMNLDGVVITVNPSMTDFYECFLDFKPLPKAKISHYNFANGHPGVGLYLDLKTAVERVKKIYNHRRPESNLYSYFCELKLSNFLLPDRLYYKASDPVMSPDMLEYFFIEKADILKNLSVNDLLELSSMYPEDGYKRVFRDDRIRKEVRYHVNIKAQNGFDNQPTGQLVILDVGRNGIRVASDRQLSGIVRFKVKVSDECIAEIRGEVRWENNNVYGIRLHRTDKHWENFIKYLDSDFGAILQKATQPENGLASPNFLKTGG